MSMPSHTRHRQPRSRLGDHDARTWCGALGLAVGLTLGLVGCSADRDPAASASSSSPVRSSPAGDRASASPAPPSDTRQRLRVDATTRHYLLHRPRPGGTSAGRKPPLVIAFHGRGATAAEMREVTRLDKAADARGMLVAYPEGLREAWGAGTAPTRTRPDPDADVRFTEALVKRLVADERADPRQVYTVGFSNGGSMALRIAAQRPRLVAGTASVSGEIPTGPGTFKPSGPVPTVIVYGAADPVRPLAGLRDPGPAPTGEEPVMATMSARGSAQAFADAGRAGRPTTVPEAGYDRTVWRPRASDTSEAEVQLLVLHGAGHTWPGTHARPPKGFGRVSTALDATDTVLDFLTQQR